MRRISPRAPPAPPRRKDYPSQTDSSRLGGGPMITGVQDVYYEVQDMKRAIAFYRNVLNLAVTEESSACSAMNVGGLPVGLDSTDGKPTTKRAFLTLKTT